MTFLQNLAKRYREWAEIRKAEAELQAYSDRELNDLGISRADIPSLVRQRSALPTEADAELSARALRRADAA